MANPLASWFEAAQFAWEVQCVIALRLMRLATGGAVAQREAARMVWEKAAAVPTAQVAATAALATERKPARAAFKSYRSAVRRNRRRLSPKKR
jgi:hypothetical protein